MTLGHQKSIYPMAASPARYITDSRRFAEWEREREFISQTDKHNNTKQ